MICLKHHTFYRILSRCLPLLLLVPLLMISSGPLQGAEVQSTERLTLNGKLIEKSKKPDISRNISGVAAKGGILVVGADEGGDILVFKKKDELKYSEAAHVCIPLDGKKCGDARKGAEIDIEDIAWGNKYLYVVGSHSIARKKVKSKKSPEENRQRLETIKIEPTRDQLFRIELDKDGKVAEGTKIQQINLRKLLNNHRVLSLFTPIPSKENGIDIEGLAVKEVDGHDQLYIGFRGPVLRGNHALVMVLEFKGGKFKESNIKQDAEHLKVHYLNLGGRGVRGMTELESGGFLLLTGPVGDALLGDGKSRYQVVFWNGKEDDLSGVARKSLCNVPAPDGSKAEGIELLNKNKTATEVYRFVVVYDGAKKGGATVFTCKPK